MPQRATGAATKGIPRRGIEGSAHRQIGETIGTTGQYVNRVIKKKDGIINKTFVQIMEALGYDIEMTYVKRGE